MAVISSELRRARSMDDPISAVGQDGAVTNPYSTVDVATAGCARYSYADPIATDDFRALRLDDGRVLLARGDAAADAACDSAGTALNSDAIEVTSLTFSNPGGSARRIDVVLTGRLRNPPAYMTDTPAMATTAKTIRQTISIRSNGT